MRVVMTDIAHDRSVNVSNAPREPVSSGSAYDPSVSGDVRRVGFESIDQSGSGRSRSMALWLFDRAHASTQLIAQGSFGATYEPRISAHVARWSSRTRPLAVTAASGYTQGLIRTGPPSWPVARTDHAAR
jgi:hypothetical protein